MKELKAYYRAVERLREIFSEYFSVRSKFKTRIFAVKLF